MSRSSSVTAGGVSMSLNDLLAYARSISATAPARTASRVLTRASLEVMRTPRLRKNAHRRRDGLGLASAHASAA